LHLVLAATLVACTRAADRREATETPGASRSLTLELAAEPVNGEVPLTVRFAARLVGEIADPAEFGCPTLAWTLDERDEGQVVIARPEGCAPGMLPRAFALEHTYTTARQYEASVRFIARDVSPSNVVQIVVRGPTTTPAPRVAISGPTIVIATPAGTRVAQAQITGPAAPPTEAGGAGTKAVGVPQVRATVAVATQAVATQAVATGAARMTPAPGRVVARSTPTTGRVAAVTSVAPGTRVAARPTGMLIFVTPVRTAVAVVAGSAAPPTIAGARIAFPTGAIRPVPPVTPAGGITIVPPPNLRPTGVVAPPAPTPYLQPPAPGPVIPIQPPALPTVPPALPTAPVPFPTAPGGVATAIGPRAAARRVLPGDLYYLAQADRGLWRLPSSGESPAPLVTAMPVDGGYAVAPNGTVAFSSGGALYVLNPGAGGPARLAVSGGLPVWSRNGRQLAYATLDGASVTGVSVYDIAARRHSSLTGAGGPVAWSRDGRWLLVGVVEVGMALVRTEDRTWTDLPFENVLEAGWLPDRDVVWMTGRGLRLLTLGEEWVQTTLLPDDERTSTVVVRPDDKLVVLVHAWTGDTATAYIVDLSSTDLTLRQAGPPFAVSYLDGLAWAPDGRHLAVAGEGGIDLLDPFTGARVPLVGLPAAEPRWVLGR